MEKLLGASDGLKREPYDNTPVELELLLQPAVYEVIEAGETVRRYSRIVKYASKYQFFRKALKVLDGSLFYVSGTEDNYPKYQKLHDSDYVVLIPARNQSFCRLEVFCGMYGNYVFGETPASEDFLTAQEKLDSWIKDEEVFTCYYDSAFVRRYVPYQRMGFRYVPDGSAEVKCLAECLQQFVSKDNPDYSVLYSEQAEHRMLCLCNGTNGVYKLCPINPGDWVIRSQMPKSKIQILYDNVFNVRYKVVI